MTLGNMRHLGVHRLVASCLRDACRHQGLIDVSKYPDVVCQQGRVRQVRCASPHRRAAKLERTAATREPDWQDVAVASALTDPKPTDSDLVRYKKNNSKINEPKGVNPGEISPSEVVIFE